MAIRISRAVGGTPESWLRMQEALDLWTAEIKFKKNPSIAPKVLAAWKKKSPCIAARAFCLAPRPGLEPGTYGLTEIQARQKTI